MKGNVDPGEKVNGWDGQLDIVPPVGITVDCRRIDTSTDSSSQSGPIHINHLVKGT